MKIEVGENREIVLKEVFNGILLESRDKEQFGICMRDTGFEFQYNRIWYEAKNGELKKMPTESSKYKTENCSNKGESKNRTRS